MDYDIRNALAEKMAREIADEMDASLFRKMYTSFLKEHATAYVHNDTVIFEPCEGAEICILVEEKVSPIMSEFFAYVPTNQVCYRFDECGTTRLTDIGTIKLIKSKAEIIAKTILQR